MIPQSPARIYKSQLRSHFKNELHRLYATFNFEGHGAGSHNSFGVLNILNDEVLAPKQEIKRPAEKNTMTVILPLVGVLNYSTTTFAKTIYPGEVAILSSTNVTIKNPYRDENINYLYVMFSECNALAKDDVSNFDQNKKGILQPILKQPELLGYTGLFNGREEILYKLTNPENGLFIFVINGAFEVMGRLLESRDALALWDINEADIEALSENAIFLLFEFPYKPFTA